MASPRRLNVDAYDAYMQWLKERQEQCRQDARNPATRGSVTWEHYYATLATVYELCRSKAANLTVPPTRE